MGKSDLLPPSTPTIGREGDDGDRELVRFAFRVTRSPLECHGKPLRRAHTLTALMRPVKHGEQGINTGS
jgi:hypothetical protein